MAKALNSVVAGDFQGKTVRQSFSGKVIIDAGHLGGMVGMLCKVVLAVALTIFLNSVFGQSVIWIGIVFGIAIFVYLGKKKIKINSSTVDSYELITDEHSKSAASGIARGLVGGALLGPVGMLGGALSAKSNSTYHVAIQLKNGKHSLLQVDSKIYNAIIKQCFGISGLNKMESSNNDLQLIDSSSEIAKYKKLLDDGAITEDEYNEKKKQLLDL